MAESNKKSKAQSAQTLLKTDKSFLNNAVVLFGSAMETVCDHFGSKAPAYVMRILDQMLHSILFLGHIRIPRYIEPEHIFAESEIVRIIVEDFPEPFALYQSHVARRAPFSYFLELATICCNQINEERVKETLRVMLALCNKARGEYPLISTVICMCESGTSRYYGASLSCGSGQAKGIMTAVSCLHVWHPKVSSAVTSVFHEVTGEPHGIEQPHSIRLPDMVRCRAYDVADMSKVKPPCKRCNQLYSLPDHIDKENTPGNCAETEAISNLLHAEQGVAHQTNITGGVYNPQEIEQRMTVFFDGKKKEISSGADYSINIVYPPI